MDMKAVVAAAPAAGVRYLIVEQDSNWVKGDPIESIRVSLENFKNPIHAVFESMSCYTTSSLTMAVHEPSIGNGLLKDCRPDEFNPK